MFSGEINRTMERIRSQHDELLFEQFERHGFSKEHVIDLAMEGRISRTRVTGASYEEYTDYYEVFGERLFSIHKIQILSNEGNKYKFEVLYSITDIKKPVVKNFNQEQCDRIYGISCVSDTACRDTCDMDCPYDKKKETCDESN